MSISIDACTRLGLTPIGVLWLIFVALGNVFLNEDALDLLGVVASFEGSLAGGDLVAAQDVELHM